jgi:hypothetical protein
MKTSAIERCTVSIADIGRGVSRPQVGSTVFHTSLPTPRAGRGEARSLIFGEVLEEHSNEGKGGDRGETAGSVSQPCVRQCTRNDGADGKEDDPREVGVVDQCTKRLRQKFHAPCSAKI